jgi:hypothetical protein
VLETALRTDLVGHHDFFFLASSAKSDSLEKDYPSIGRFQRCGGWVGFSMMEFHLSDALLLCFLCVQQFLLRFVGLADQGKEDIVFRFIIIEYIVA